MTKQDSPAPPLHYDIAISGAGMIGLTLALALARSGLSVHLIDPVDPATHVSQQDDQRATAIIRSSWEMFDVIGVAEQLGDAASPINAIAVREKQGAKPLRFDAEQGDVMGYMVPNTALIAALLAQIAKESAISCYFGKSCVAREEHDSGVTLTLDDGTELTADVQVVAEGRHSQSLKSGGFSATEWGYDHHAIVATLAHAHGHDGVAFQHFLPGGPVALLPLGDVSDGSDLPPHRSSLVWSMPSEQADGLMALGPRGFCAELARHIGDITGDVQLAGDRGRFPLTFHNVTNPVRGRTVLIGDTAHALHPIAGQGFNLGLRDVACFAEIMAEAVRMGLECGNSDMLQRYSDWRAGDVTLMASVTDSLMRIFALPEPLAGLRRTGMEAVGAVEPLRNWLAAEARGESGNLPRLLQGVAV
ncbi:FAD-dependent oxidoreductase [Alterisphingorhabdus coralli]|uniref:FAD-dependent monooxygenase n=1 Tax=Alterisphingorhabdus coralli TaxID=3071408 RepID=A0AA97F6C2_9SPHN|nr:FAD-dependent oxidoreductase [Parasphingorhabdus sp. SCSIO 66989]WOE75209.1 FAD-dependent monooxygenase [Parasphingorhabdus sp. SCSIO 66989]